MELDIIHETRYEYSPSVEMAQHVAYLRPLETPWQKVVTHDLRIDPTPAHRIDSTDVWGNHRCFFSLQASHKQLTLTAHSKVHTSAPSPAISQKSWESLREQCRYQAGAAWLPATEFVFASPRVPCHDAFVEYAQQSFTADRSAKDAAIDLMHRINTDFEYDARSTEVHTTPLESLALRKGVCQDFAHIMLACLRSLGLPARYVSGYLLTHPPEGQARLIGSDASHAWVSLYLPDLQGEDKSWNWLDLDPTNAREGWGTPGEDYITLATGRDYADISPVRGVIHGGSSHTLEVAVTVRPEAEVLA